MSSPGAGAELKHLLNGVKSKTLKPKTLNLKDEGLNLNDEVLSKNAESLKDKGFNLKVLGEAVKGATNNRQTVAVWSPTISAVLWYLKKTTPEFSISEEARAILETGLEKKYPDLYKLVTEEMERRR